MSEGSGSSNEVSQSEANDFGTGTNAANDNGYNDPVEESQLEVVPLYNFSCTA
jgi:hypothetical protein